VPRRWPLHVRILTGLAGGVAAGILANGTAAGTPWLEWATDHVTEPFGRLFLRLIFMVVLPLVFSALALGVAGLGDVRRLGRVGAKTFVYTIGATGLSVALGLTLVNVVRPGAGLSDATREALRAGAARTAAGAGGVNTSAVVGASTGGASAPVGLEAVLAIVPDNPLRAAVNGDMLAVMFFSLMVGVGIALAPTSSTAPLVAILQGLYTVVMRIIDVAMGLAPYGVAALLFTLTARFGIEVLQQLAVYVAVVLGGLAFHQFVTYSVIVRLLGKVSPGLFFRRIRSVMVTAFSTSSSNVTLPVALRTTEHDLGVPREIGNFVLTLGSTANQNGTALFEGVTVLFLAQFYGVELGLRAQLLVVLMSILAGVGTAGVPGGSLPLIVPVLVTVGIPAEGIGIIFGVDRLLDMCRTVLNVTGDIVAAVVVARSEGGLDVPVTLPESA
jgi:DAACS family dicarboxylate/amino acid:cation (Na+ or H+) symporter